MELYDVMRTTFAARDFTDELVPDEACCCVSRSIWWWRH
jgi:hypothetical protein